MKTRSPLRAWLLGLALGVLLTLLSTPATRWLTRAQLAAAGLTFGTPAAQVRGADDARQRAVTTHPNDFLLQMAAPQGDGDDRHLVAYLRTLVPRFQDSPSLYANLLRHEIGSPQDKGSVYLSRPEDWYLSSQPSPLGVKTPPPPDPAALAAFDAAAAAGERLDPDNAFFPLMRAAGLFAARRDDDARAAVLRAGRKPAWREYVADEINGRLRLADAAYGPGEALSRAAIVASVLYPHYSALRGAARVSIAQAAHMEQAGQVEQGLSLRRAMMHCGGLMRADSTTYIGSLVGIAIAAIATARPGGAPLIRASPGSTVSPEQTAQRRLQAFCLYARRTGHPEDAARAQSEQAAGQAARGLFKKAEDRSIFGGPQLAHLGAWWVGDLLTLANAFWLLVLAAVAAGLTRWTVSGRQGTPLARPTLWGIVVMLLTAALVALVVFSDYEALDGVTFVSALILGPLAGLLLIRLSRASIPERIVWRRNAARGARAFLLTGLTLLALGALAAGQARGVVGFAAALRDMTGQSGTDDGTATSQAQQIKVMAVLASLSVPLLLLIGFSIAGRVRRIPVSSALLGDFRTVGPPLACVLLIAYGGLALGTLRQERAMADGLARMVQHEGRYFASLAGQPWPAPPG